MKKEIFVDTFWQEKRGGGREVGREREKKTFFLSLNLLLERKKKVFSLSQDFFGENFSVRLSGLFFYSFPLSFFLGGGGNEKSCFVKYLFFVDFSVILFFLGALYVNCANCTFFLSLKVYRICTLLQLKSRNFCSFDRESPLIGFLSSRFKRQRKKSFFCLPSLPSSVRLPPVGQGEGGGGAGGGGGIARGALVPNEPL